MQALTALGRGDVGHDDSLNAFDLQPPSYQASELFGSDSLAPLPYTFNDDETATFIDYANIEYVDIPMDLPNCLSTLGLSSETFQSEEMVPTSYVSNDVASLVVTQSNIPRVWATEHDWTRHRALITELYGENKLPKVMSIMESQQNFKATLVNNSKVMYPLLTSLNTYSVKMYKTHIAKWGLDKKNKAPEMRAIVRKNKWRAEQGKCSNFRVRKRQLKFAEVVRYWERKGVTIDEVIARSIASPTPEAVECFTPVSSPIMPPEDLATPEYILRIIRGYIAASFESGTWVKTDPCTTCYSIKDECGTDYPSEFGNFCNLAARLLKMKKFDEMERTLSAASAISWKMLLAEQPSTLEVILDLMGYIRSRHDHEMALRILRQLSATSKELLGESHPLSLFVAWLAAIQWPQIKDIISRCFDVIIDDFESLFGPMHLSTLNCRLSLSKVGSNPAILRRLLDKCESTLGSYDGRTLDVRMWLMDCIFTKGHYAEAKRMGDDLLAYVQRNEERVQAGWFSTVSHQIIAVCQYALGEPHLAIPNLEVAIHLYMREHGAQDGLVRKWLFTLEKWYIEQGQLNAAAVVQDQRVKLLESTEIA